MKIKTQLPKLLIILFFLWILISTVRTLYNLSKLFTEEKAWMHLSEEEKKNKSYGDIEIIYRKITGITKKGDCIFLVSQKDTAYFLLRYLLYPQKIYWLNGQADTRNHRTKNCHYTLYYQTPVGKDKKGNNIKIAEFKNKDTEKSVLYTQHSL